MPILTSPAVAITEKDYSQVVPFAATGEGALAGDFARGPINMPVLVSSVDDLELFFGRPTDTNYKAWFSAYNFLQYSSKLWVVRILPVGALNAADTTALLIENKNVFESKVDAADAGLTAAGLFIAKSAGVVGNSLRVIMLDNDAYIAFSADTTSYLDENGDHLKKYFRTEGPTTSAWMSDTIKNTTAMDEIHVIILDATGAITGVKNRVLEVHEGLSKVADAKDYLDQNIYYVNYLNNNSEWIYSTYVSPVFTLPTGTLNWGILSADATTGVFKELDATVNETLSGGVAGSLVAANGVSALQTGFNMFLDKDEINVSYLITADYPVAVQKYVVDSIAEVRKDAIAFISSHDDSKPFTDRTTLVSDLRSFRDTTLNVNSSYAVLDSGYKYQFDGFAQKYRWIPLAADVAGVCARLDSEHESWYSPGGFTRGRIKNVLKLSSNLNQPSRDQLYPKQINAVVSFPGKGTVLFGDRTLQAKPSAFQSIHIRRLFIILEKAIADAAQYQLFELNNASTRNRFIGMVEPFLRSVQSRDGLADFKVVCDSSNNTDDTVARGEFVADIYIKPLYSIQYVILNFVATKSSIQFNQVVGK